MVAKQGVAVRRISLDHENANYIEGRSMASILLLSLSMLKNSNYLPKASL